MNLRSAACFAPALLATLLAAAPAAAQPNPAQNYPVKPIRWIITVVPGGGADVTTRVLGGKLTEAWGQQVVVDNRPGGNGVVGMELAARAAPDGYTIVLGTIGPVAVNPSLYPKLPYNPVKDYAPIMHAVTALNALVVHPSVPARTLAEFVTYAKGSGGKLNYGSSGVGFADHLAGELFSSLTGAKMLHVPYKGGTPAMLDLVGGNIQLIFATISTAHAHMASGKIRALAVTSAKRTPLYPDLPAVAEVVPGFELDNWYGIFAPRDTPRPIVMKLFNEIRRVLDLADVKERLAAMGIAPTPSPSPEHFAKFIPAEIAKYAKFVQQTGAKAN